VLSSNFSCLAFLRIWCSVYASRSDVIDFGLRLVLSNPPLVSRHRAATLAVLLIPPIPSGKSRRTTQTDFLPITRGGMTYPFYF